MKTDPIVVTYDYWESWTNPRDKKYHSAGYSIHQQSGRLARKYMNDAELSMTYTGGTFLVPNTLDPLED